MEACLQFKITLAGLHISAPVYFLAGWTEGEGSAASSIHLVKVQRVRWREQGGQDPFCSKIRSFLWVFCRPLGDVGHWGWPEGKGTFTAFLLKVLLPSSCQCPPHPSTRTPNVCSRSAHSIRAGPGLNEDGGELGFCSEPLPTCVD